MTLAIMGKQFLSDKFRPYMESGSPCPRERRTAASLKQYINKSSYNNLGYGLVTLYKLLAYA